MKNLVLAALLMLAALISPCPAQSSDSHAADFKTFYAQFLAAVKANDKLKLADLIAFPVDDWAVETKGNVQEGPIKDRAEFLARYNLLFTSSMRSHALKAKPMALQDDRYVTIWDDADSEFSFEFGYIAGTGYRLTSYSVGPR